MLTHTLLIADDQPEVRRLLRMSLGYGKYRLLEAESGEAALHVARAEHPEIVVLDVMMPGRLDGLDVCRALKDDPETASAYVVLLTARGQTGDQVAGRAAGADAYMIKPFSPARLIEVIERRADRHVTVRAYGH